MCTVTVIQLATGGFRLVTNRDENPARSPATPPRWQERASGEPRAIWPVDSQAGGTWVAAGEQGLALTLLNGNPREPIPAPDPDRRQSRGVLIPRLIGLRDAAAVVDALPGFGLDRFEPFRLVAVDLLDGLRILDASWDGRSLTTGDLGPGPACFASSGLGDWLVKPRLPLFAEMVSNPGPDPATQDAFHRHRWPDRPGISVFMHRDGAETISTTRVQVQPSESGRFAVTVEYEPVAHAVTH